MQGLIRCERPRVRVRSTLVKLAVSKTVSRAMNETLGPDLFRDEYAEKAARDNRLNAVELYTNEAMTENLAMYPSLGYLEIERKEQDGYKRVFFRKLV